MKTLFLSLAVLVSVIFVSEAKTYVVFDKSSGEIKGVADISDDSILDWTKDNILKEAGEAYRGKQAYEIKYKNNKLSLATNEEVAEHKSTIEANTVNTKKQEALETLGLTETDIENIKKLKA
jgi:hypothetical protein